VVAVIGRFVTGLGNTGLGLAAGHTVTGDLNSAYGNSAGQLGDGQPQYGRRCAGRCQRQRLLQRRLRRQRWRWCDGQRRRRDRSQCRQPAIPSLLASMRGPRRTEWWRLAKHRLRPLPTPCRSAGRGGSGYFGYLFSNVAIPVAPEPAAVSVVPVGRDNGGHADEDMQRRSSELETLVRQQQRIAHLESRATTPAK
jgi:hypothetical protein